MSDELTPLEEQAIDAMLDETLAGAGPPDLSHDILERLRQDPSGVGAIIQLDDRSAAPAQARATSTRNVSVFITVIAALAATFLIAIWLRSADPSLADPSPGLVANDPAPTGLETTTPLPATPQIEIPPSPAPDSPPPRKPPTGIPLIVGTAPPSDQPMPDDKSTELPVSSEPLQAVVLVSQQVGSDLRGYWDAIGINPSSDASTDEIVARLSMALGVELSAESIDDPQLLQTELTQRDVARAIATGWLQQITESGLSRVSEDASNALIDELAVCFQSEQDFDRTLAGWIGGQSSGTSAFYAAVSSGPKHARDDSALIRRIAALTMNVDLRCTRCHDAYIEGNGRQEDFWAFTAFLRRGVTRGRDGQVRIDASHDSGEPFFYELADGRQRIVEPGVSPKWMNTDQPISSVRRWSEALIGSDELARGVVNSLWQLVHGQPLHGRVVDPISAPHNDALDRLEEDLVQDLRRSRFNIARTLALIIASPATRRSVPDALLPETMLVAEESEIKAAKNAVDAFAAAEPPHTDLPRSDRLAQSMRATGAELNTKGNSIVAQIDGKNAAGNTQPDSNNLAADFPGPSKTLPAQWLARIEDETSQVEHLGYLAGMSEVPQGILDAADTMRTANGNPTALTRLWWTLRP